MEINVVMLSHFRPKDWLTSVDLKDAYFHISIYPAHRKFLRFSCQGTAYEFSFRPLIGHESVQQMFWSSSDTAENSRSQSVSLFGWSSLCSIMAAGRDRCKSAHVSLRELRFQNNKMKSCLVPIKEIIYLGLYRRSASGQFTTVYPFFRRGRRSHSDYGPDLLNGANWRESAFPQMRQWEWQVLHVIYCWRAN